VVEIPRVAYHYALHYLTSAGGFGASGAEESVGGPLLPTWAINGTSLGCCNSVWIYVSRIVITNCTTAIIMRFPRASNVCADERSNKQPSSAETYM